MVGWRKVWNTAMHYVPRFVLRVLPPLPALCQFVVALRLHYAYTTRMSVWSETYVPAQPLVPSRAELPCVCLVELPLSSTAVLADSVSGMGTVECWGPHWLLLSSYTIQFGLCCSEFAASSTFLDFDPVPVWLSSQSWAQFADSVLFVGNYNPPPNNTWYLLLLLSPFFG